MIYIGRIRKRPEMRGGVDANLCAGRSEVDSLGGRRSVRRCDELMQRLGIGVECAVKTRLHLCIPRSLTSGIVPLGHKWSGLACLIRYTALISLNCTVIVLLCA